MSDSQALQPKHRILYFNTKRQAEKYVEDRLDPGTAYQIEPSTGGGWSLEFEAWDDE